MTLESDRAVISLSDGRTLSAALVVGSDGAASLSRKLAGIETAGWNYDQRAFVTHVRTEHSHARTAWQRFLETSYRVPSPGRRSQLDRVDDAPRNANTSRPFA